MTDKQAHREIQVVERFLAVRGTPRHAFSIEKRRPPEPDVLVRYSSGSCVALEVGEILAEGYAKDHQDSIASEVALKGFLTSTLPPEARDKFKEKYCDARLFFRFARGSSLHRRRQVLRKAFAKLLQLDDGFTGVALEQDAALSGVLRSVHIGRGRFKGPQFDVPAGGWVADPTTQLIQKKFAKDYITDYPRQLLAYINLNPMFPEAVWRGDLLDFLRAQLAPLPFGKVWIFDYASDKVLLEYPNPDDL